MPSGTIQDLEHKKFAEYGGKVGPRVFLYGEDGLLVTPLSRDDLYEEGEQAASATGLAVLGKDYDDKLYTLPVRTRRSGVARGLASIPAAYIADEDWDAVEASWQYDDWRLTQQGILRVALENIASTPLITGFATETTLNNILSALALVPVTGDFYPATQPISAASLPLPSGAATQATLATLLLEATFTGVFSSLLTSRNLDVDESGDNQVDTACKLYGYYVFNNAAAVRYLKLYNKATAPTVGTDTPVITIPLPPQAAANVSFVQGIAFSLGLGVGATTGVADNNTGAPAANDVIINLFYK